MNRMRHMVTRYYLYGVLNLIILVATFGFTCPALISASDLTLNIVGVSVAVLLPLLLYWLNRSVIGELWNLYRPTVAIDK